MKLSEIKNEDALDVLADILEPASEIIGDKEIAEILSGNDKMRNIKAVRVAIKNHKKAVISILATLDGVPVEEYSCNVLTIPIKLLEILNDEELIKVFQSQVQMTDEKYSGLATENTEGTEAK